MLPAPRLERLTRCLLGLVLLGIGVGLTVEADLGLSPWDVFHQGLGERTGLTIGTAAIVTSFGVLALWIPLRQWPGVGTLANAVIIGLVTDATVAVVDAPSALAPRVAIGAVGLLLWGPGSGLYIGAGLRAGPRDGLMVGIAQRGLPVAGVRLGIEAAALGVGWVLGGTVGVGTVAFALGVGPVVAYCLPRLAMEPPPTRIPTATA